MTDKILTITREEIINSLIEDDCRLIMSGREPDYLYNIFRYGVCGYDKYSNKKLIEEYQDDIQAKIKIRKD